MKKALNRGFTLIELLVVIAIIGILASVILASLDSARAKGTDAAVKSDLDNSRAQAELYYDNGTGTNTNSYSGVCAAAQSSQGINNMLSDAAAKIGGGATVVTTVATASSYTTVTCHDSATAWAAAAPMRSVGSSSSPIYFCVDSTGAAKLGTATAPEALAANAYACP